jgi:hypothetical protein
MQPARFALIALAAAALIAPPLTSSARAAPPKPPEHLLPQAIQIEHKETLEQLTALTHHKGAVGLEASKALVLLKRHMDREQEFILPPLTLLPLLAEGKVTPDMAWALAMTDRVRAERETLFKDHTEITDALSALVAAATSARDKEAKEFAESAVADSLTDLEILEPTLMLINDTLRAKLPAAK